MTKMNKEDKQKIWDFIFDNLEMVLDPLGALYYWCAGSILGTWKDLKKTAKRVFISLGFITISLAGMLIISMSFKWQAGTTVVAFISAILFLILWTAGNGIAEGLEALKSPLDEGVSDKARNAISKSGKVLKKIFHPLCSVALIMSFVAFWINTWGFSSVWTQHFAVVLTASTFVLILWTYKGQKGPWFSRSLLILVVVSLGLYAKAPIINWYNSSDATLVRKVRSRIDTKLANMERESSINETKASATYAQVLVDSLSFLDQAQLDADGNITSLTPAPITNFKVRRNGQDTVVNYLKRGDMILIADSRNHGATYRNERYVQVYLPDANYGKFAYGQAYYVRHALVKIRDGLALAKNIELESDDWRKRTPAMLFSSNSITGTKLALKTYEKPYHLARGYKIDVASEDKNIEFALEFRSGRTVTSYQFHNGTIRMDEPFRITNTDADKISFVVKRA